MLVRNLAIHVVYTLCVVEVYATTVWWNRPVHETPDELLALQDLLDASAAAAGPHLRSIISEDRRVDAVALCERLQGMCLLVLATVTAHVLPLVGPVDGYFLHGTFVFSSARNSVRMRH